MNKLRQLVREKFPAGWELLYQKIEGYKTSYRVTSYTKEDSTTCTRMEAWEVKAWAKALDVSASVLIYDCGCGYDVLSPKEIDLLIKDEGLYNSYAHKAA